MATFVVTFFLMIFLVAIMAIGAIFQNKPIKGSCGGLASLGMASDCDICGGDRAKCDEVSTDKKTNEESVQQAQFYDVGSKF